MKPSVEVSRLPLNCDIPLMISSEKPHNVWNAYFNSIEAAGTQQLRSVTGLSLDSSNNSSWGEVEAPGIENFERARDNLQTPKCLKLRPLLLVAVVEASPTRLLQGFQELCKLNPSPGNSWLITIFHYWNHISDNFSAVSQELQQRGVGSRCDYKIAVNETISKLHSGLVEKQIPKFNWPSPSWETCLRISLGKGLCQSGIPLVRFVLKLRN